jgi:hypothetical protein
MIAAFNHIKRWGLDDSGASRLQTATRASRSGADREKRAASTIPGDAQNLDENSRESV